MLDGAAINAKTDESRKKRITNERTKRKRRIKRRRLFQSIIIIKICHLQYDCVRTAKEKLKPKTARLKSN